MKKYLTYLAILLVFSITMISVPAFAEEYITNYLYEYDGYYLSGVDGANQTKTNLSAGDWPTEFRTEYSDFNSTYTVLGFGSEDVSIPSNRNIMFGFEIPEVTGTVLYEEINIVLRGYDINGKYAFFSLSVSLTDFSVSYKNGLLAGIPKVFADGTISHEWEVSSGINSFLIFNGITSVDITEIYIFANCSSGNTSGYMQAIFVDPGFFGWMYEDVNALPPSVDNVTVSSSSPGPYYPGTDVQLNAEVVGTGIVPGEPESTVYWYVHGNTSDDTYIDNDGLLTIANDETATALEIDAISTYDSTKSATLELPITYPLEGVQIVPSGPQYFTESAKRREIQYNLFLPNGDPFDYQLIEWYAQASSGHESYFRIDDTGLLVIEPNAPAGSSCTIQFAYQSNPEELSPVGAIVKIVTQEEGIYDELDGFINGDHGFDSSGSDFSGAAGDLQNSSNQMNNAMSGGMNHLGAMMNSVDFTTTLTTLSSGMDALFEGHEVTICGVTANPFELVVTILAIAILLPLALKFIFRKWGSGSSGGGTDA